MDVKQQLEQDLAQFRQAAFEATLKVGAPELALVNYHRCTAVVEYVTNLLKELATEDMKDGERVSS